MRICILCEESKVLQAREKMKNDNILKIDLSPRLSYYDNSDVLNITNIDA